MMAATVVMVIEPEYVIVVITVFIDNYGAIAIIGCIVNGRCPCNTVRDFNCSGHDDPAPAEFLTVDQHKRIGDHPVVFLAQDIYSVG